MTAFEPHPEVRAKLSRHVESWPRVTIDGRAVSDHCGEATLVTPESFSWNRGSATLVGSREGLRVETITLDELVCEPVGVMKLDIEGHELAALNGARRLLRDGQIRDIVFEDHEAENSPVFEHLRRHGYTLFGLARTLFGVVPVEPLPPRAHAPLGVRELSRDARSRARLRAFTSSGLGVPYRS